MSARTRFEALGASAQDSGDKGSEEDDGVCLWTQCGALLIEEPSDSSSSAPGLILCNKCPCDCICKSDSSSSEGSNSFSGSGSESGSGIIPTGDCIDKSELPQCFSIKVSGKACNQPFDNVVVEVCQTSVDGNKYSYKTNNSVDVPNTTVKIIGVVVDVDGGSVKVSASVKTCEKKVSSGNNSNQQGQEEECIECAGSAEKEYSAPCEGEEVLSPTNFDSGNALFKLALSCECEEDCIEASKLPPTVTVKVKGKICSTSFETNMTLDKGSVSGVDYSYSLKEEFVIPNLSNVAIKRFEVSMKKNVATAHITVRSGSRNCTATISKKFDKCERNECVNPKKFSSEKMTFDFEELTCSPKCPEPSHSDSCSTPWEYPDDLLIHYKGQACEGEDFDESYTLDFIKAEGGKVVYGISGQESWGSYSCSLEVNEKTGEGKLSVQQNENATSTSSAKSCSGSTTITKSDAVTEVCGKKRVDVSAFTGKDVIFDLGTLNCEGCPPACIPAESMPDKIDFQYSLKDNINKINKSGTIPLSKQSESSILKVIYASKVEDSYKEFGKNIEFKFTIAGKVDLESVIVNKSEFNNLKDGSIVGLLTVDSDDKCCHFEKAIELWNCEEIAYFPNPKSNKFKKAVYPFKIELNCNPACSVECLDDYHYLPNDFTVNVKFVKSNCPGKPSVEYKVFMEGDGTLGDYRTDFGKQHDMKDSWMGKVYRVKGTADGFKEIFFIASVSGWGKLSFTGFRLGLDELGNYKCRSSTIITKTPCPTNVRYSYVNPRYVKSIVVDDLICDDCDSDSDTKECITEDEIPGNLTIKVKGEAPAGTFFEGDVTLNKKSFSFGDSVTYHLDKEFSIGGVDGFSKAELVIHLDSTRDNECELTLVRTVAVSPTKTCECSKTKEFSLGTFPICDEYGYFPNPKWLSADKFLFDMESLECYGCEVEECTRLESMPPIIEVPIHITVCKNYRLEKTVTCVVRYRKEKNSDLSEDVKKVVYTPLNSCFKNSLVTFIQEEDVGRCVVQVPQVYDVSGALMIILQGLNQIYEIRQDCTGLNMFINPEYLEKHGAFFVGHPSGQYNCDSEFKCCENEEPPQDSSSSSKSGGEPPHPETCLDEPTLLPEEFDAPIKFVLGAPCFKELEFDVKFVRYIPQAAVSKDFVLYFADTEEYYAKASVERGRNLIVVEIELYEENSTKRPCKGRVVCYGREVGENCFPDPAWFDTPFVINGTCSDGYCPDMSDSSDSCHPALPDAVSLTYEMQVENCEQKTKTVTVTGNCSSRIVNGKCQNCTYTFDYTENNENYIGRFEIDTCQLLLDYAEITIRNLDEDDGERVCTTIRQGQMSLNDGNGCLKDLTSLSPVQVIGRCTECDDVDSRCILPRNLPYSITIRVKATISGSGRVLEDTLTLTQYSVLSGQYSYKVYQDTSFAGEIVEEAELYGGDDGTVSLSVRFRINGQTCIEGTSFTVGLCRDGFVINPVKFVNGKKIFDVGTVECTEPGSDSSSSHACFPASRLPDSMNFSITAHICGHTWTFGLNLVKEDYYGDITYIAPEDTSVSSHAAKTVINGVTIICTYAALTFEPGYVVLRGGFYAYTDDADSCYASMSSSVPISWGGVVVASTTPSYLDDGTECYVDPASFTHSFDVGELTCCDDNESCDCNCDGDFASEEEWRKRINKWCNGFCGICGDGVDDSSSSGPNKTTITANDIVVEHGDTGSVTVFVNWDAKQGDTKQLRISHKKED